MRRLRSFEAALKCSRACVGGVWAGAGAAAYGQDGRGAQHLAVFQHLTQAKIASPLSVGYGERGRYSLMQEMTVPAEPVGAMIPVKFEAQTVKRFARGRISLPAGAMAAHACWIWKGRVRRILWR